MGAYEENLAALKAEARVERDLAAAKAAQDPVRYEHKHFLLLLLEARLAKGWSQTDLAKQLGTTQSVIARIESGKGNPTLRTLLLIAKVLGVHLVLE